LGFLKAENFFDIYQLIKKDPKREVSKLKSKLLILSVSVRKGL